MMNNKKRGRPLEKPATMKDGFYIEVRNRVSTDRGIRLYSDTQKGMEENIRHYTRSKQVVILGELRKQKWVTKPVTAN